MTWYNDSGIAITDTLTLFNRMVDNAVTEGWTETIPREDWVNPLGDTEKRCQLQGPGFDASHRFHVQLRTNHNLAEDRWDIQARAVFSYDSGQDWDNQQFLGASDHWVRMPVGNEAMRTWMSVTATRLIIAVEIAGFYHSMYLGFALTHVAVDEYAYPLVLSSAYAGATGTMSSGVENSTSRGYRYDHSSLDSGFFATGSFGVVSVNNTYYAGNSGFYEAFFPMLPTFFDNRAPGIGNVRTLYPITMASKENALGLVWTYDSVYRINGDGLTAEDTVTISGTVYTVLKNGSNSDKNSFYVLENI